MLSIHELSPAALAAAATDNFVVHAGWVHARTLGMRVIDTPDNLVLVDSSLPCDTFNLVCRARMREDAAPTRIRETLDYFGGVGRPFSWWLSPGDEPPGLGGLLLAARLQRTETELAMAADLDALRPGALPPEGLQIRSVRTPAQLQDFARTLAGDGTPPDPQVPRFYELAAPALLAAGSPLWLYVGYLGETPVTTAELTLGGGVAGLYNILHAGGIPPARLRHRPHPAAPHRRPVPRLPHRRPPGSARGREHLHPHRLRTFRRNHRVQAPGPGCIMAAEAPVDE